MVDKRGLYIIGISGLYVSCAAVVCVFVGERVWYMSLAALHSVSSC